MADFSSWDEALAQGAIVQHVDGPSAAARWLAEHDRRIAERAYAEGVLTNDEWDWVPFNPYGPAEQACGSSGN